MNLNLQPFEQEISELLHRNRLDIRSGSSTTVVAAAKDIERLLNDNSSSKKAADRKSAAQLEVRREHAKLHG